jgi:hypothetical protein
MVALPASVLVSPDVRVKAGVDAVGTLVMLSHLADILRVAMVSVVGNAGLADTEVCIYEFS